MKERVILLLLALSISLFFLDQYVITQEPEMKNRTSMSANQADTGIEVGQKAPDFRLKTSKGEIISLSSLKGKNIFINFWASWCPPCKAEMPHVQEFYDNYKNQNIAVLSVNLTHLDRDEQTVHEFIKRNHLTFPVVYDTRGEVDEVYQANTIPTSYIIDQNGIIQHRIVGPVSTDRLKIIFSALPK